MQTSLTIKTVVAQLLNSIVLTLLANYYIKKNLYNQGGLTEDVFYFSVSNALLPPLLKIFDVSYLLYKVTRWWKCRPGTSLTNIAKKLGYESQSDYNKEWERPEFETGYEYAYILKTCIYTAFYISIQPIIALMAAIGMFLMFYANKYVLFYRSSRPKPSSSLINETLSRILNFMVVIYSLGSLTWTSFIPND